MRKFSSTMFIILVSTILALSATVTQAQALNNCSTVAGDINQGTIIEWNPLDPLPEAVGVDVELNAGDAMTFTVTQVNGGPTPVLFMHPFGSVIQSGIAPITFTFAALESDTYDFLIQVGPSSTGSVRVNWECGKGTAKPDGHIHDGRINSGDLGTLTVVYPQEDQIDVYAVNPETSEGWMVIRVMVEDLPPMDEVRTEPLLLGEAASPFDGRPIALYLLPSNEFVIAAENPDGTPYRFLWPRTE